MPTKKVTAASTRKSLRDVPRCGHLVSTRLRALLAHVQIYAC